MYDWDGLWARYEPIRFGETGEEFEMPGEARHAFSHPAPADVAWLRGVLGDERRKWLVAAVALESRVPEELLEPMLDAGIDETDPSFNRSFIEPCMDAFGPRRVNEYLLDAFTLGDGYRKAGACNAMYWAGVALEYIGRQDSYDLEHATPESRAKYEALSDIWARKRRLLLEAFVETEDVELQQHLIPALNLKLSDHPPGDRELVERATQIGLNHADEYIRHRTSVQLGNEKVFRALPQQGKRAAGDPADE